MFNSPQMDSVTGAIVEVRINNNTYKYVESINHPTYPIQKKGLYVSANKIKGIPGKVHTLQVRYNNKIYTASDSMVEVKKLDFTAANIPLKAKLTIIEDTTEIEYENLMFSGIHFNQPESYFISWSWVQFWGWEIGNQIGDGNKRISNHSYFFNTSENPEITNYSQYFNCSYPYHPQEDSIVIAKKYSISEPYKKFLIASFKVAFWNNTRFSSLAANVPTNVSNGGLGYFAACDVVSNQLTYKELFALSKEK